MLNIIVKIIESQKMFCTYSKLVITSLVSDVNGKPHFNLFTTVFFVCCWSFDPNWYLIKQIYVKLLKRFDQPHFTNLYFTMSWPHGYSRLTTHCIVVQFVYKWHTEFINSLFFKFYYKITNLLLFSVINHVRLHSFSVCICCITHGQTTS